MANSIDTKIINKLADVLNKNALSELEYEDETCRIKLQSTAAQTIVAAAPVVSAPVQAAPQPSVQADARCAIDDYSQNAGSVKSPIVGVVYLSADPTKPDYVSVGDSVKEGDIVCLIEAMKTFNPVKAPRAGKVVKILVTDRTPVEYGEPLLILE